MKKQSWRAVGWPRPHWSSVPLRSRRQGVAAAVTAAATAAARRARRSTASGRPSTRSSRRPATRARSTSSSGPATPTSRGRAVHEADRLQGRDQGRRDVRRHDRPDLDRPVRRRLGLRQRERAPDEARGRRAGQHGPDPQLRRRRRRAQEPGLQLAGRPGLRRSARPRAEPARCGGRDVVNPAPTAGRSSGTQNNPYKGKISIYDDSIFIADAAALPEGDAARPRDRQPVPAERGAVQRGRRPAEEPEAERRRVVGRLREADPVVREQGRRRSGRRGRTR